MEDFYYCCEHFPDVDKVFVDQAVNGTYKQHYRPNYYWAPSTFLLTKFVADMSRVLKVLTTCYVKNPPYFLYDWHIDDPQRNCSINIPLVASNNAHTFFRTHIKSNEYTLHEVKYIMFKPTVLNIKHEHCVINNSDSDRIVLNISLKGSYKDTVDYLKNLQFSDYGILFPDSSVGRAADC